jgi:hypothetical protein
MIQRHIPIVPEFLIKVHPNDDYEFQKILGDIIGSLDDDTTEVEVVGQKFFYTLCGLSSDLINEILLRYHTHLIIQNK